MVHATGCYRAVTICCFALLVGRTPVPAIASASDGAAGGDAAAVAQIRPLAAQYGSGVSVTVVGPYAIARWVQGGAPGETVFGRMDSGWKELFSFGGPFDPMRGQTYVGNGITAYAWDRLVGSAVPQDLADCLTHRPGTLARHCAAVPAVPTPSEAAAILVLTYYNLWNHGRFTEMYALLSARYRGAHPFDAWRKQHAPPVTPAGIVGVYRPSPTSVYVTLHDDDLASYEGTWQLARENGALKLDVPAIHQTRAGTTSEAVKVVRVYYGIMESGELGDDENAPKKMYAMLSSAYRSAHSFDVWKKTLPSMPHGTDPSIEVTSSRELSPTTVAFGLRAGALALYHGRYCVYSDFYQGTWSLVREGGRLRLDKSSVVLTQTSCPNGPPKPRSL